MVVQKSTGEVTMNALMRRIRSYMVVLSKRILKEVLP
jgi:hypothetical protein